MEIVTATEENIPAIIDLLRVSLGEGQIQKSEEYWHWKHVKNPFGTSPVLLAFENTELVGVRAFMRWEWTDGKRVYKSVRAVDTATHPRYQGKGIFRTLTLKLVERCREEGLNFIFNTPNPISRKGYLRMGWVDAGRLPVRIKLRPLSVAGSLFGNGKRDVPNKEANIKEILNDPGVSELLEQNSGGIRTSYSIPYLHWRYLDVPALSYSACVVSEDSKLQALAFYRLKESKWGVEMRVTDAFYKRPDYLLRLATSIQDQAKRQGAGYVTCSGASNFTLKPSFRLRGPAVTINTLGVGIGALNGFAEWRPALGDLELF